jgi:hypothetical protein
MATYIRRRLEAVALAMAKSFPVVTIIGPRQSGKTTLVRKVFPDYVYVNLEQPDLRLLAEQDPRAFLKRFAPPVIIDEIQRVPDLLSYIQVMVDENRTSRGQFILTGSHQIGLRAAISQSLVGRTALLRLLPLSVSELYDAGIRLDRDEYLYRGCMPRLYEDELSPTILYGQYYQTYVERDVRQIANIRNIIAFETFIRLLAGRVGQVANLSDLANSTGMSSSTLSEWLGILEASFIIFRLPPYFENFGKRLIKSPKIYFTEPGLAAWLLGIQEARQVGLSPYLGGLFENLVVVEALKARFNGGTESNLYFWRDNNGLEADLLASNFGGLTPIAIKASMTYSKDFGRAFPRLRKASDKIKAGYIIYAGDLEAEVSGDRFINFTKTEKIIEAV